MVVCKNGHSNPDGATYCSVCKVYIDATAGSAPDTPPAAPTRLKLTPAALKVHAGGKADGEVRVENNGQSDDDYVLELAGQAAGFGSLAPAGFTLPPGDAGTARLSFHPDATVDGDIGFDVIVHSKRQPDQPLSTHGTLTVGAPAPWYAIRLRWLVLAAVGAVAAVAIALVLVMRGGSGGSEWSWRVDTSGPSVFGGPGLQEMNSVVASPDGTAVAVGFDRIHGKNHPAAWTYDGAKWRPAPGGEFASMRGVFWSAAAEPGATNVVAVGQAGPRHPLVWTYSNNEWQEQCLSSACGNGGMFAVAYLRQKGIYVAVGGTVAADGHYDAAVWISKDGRQWESVSAPQFKGSQTSKDQFMRAVTVANDGLLVAAGWDGAYGAVWTSTDGKQWKLVGGDAFRPQPGNVVRLFSIAAAGSVSQAGGQDGSGAAAWTSTDHATTWKTAGFSLEPSGVSSASGLLMPTCSGCSGTVAVGYVTEDTRKTAAAWVASAPSATFERQQSDAFPTDGGSEISAVAETAKGLIAVGCGPAPEQGATRCGFPGTNENEATLTGDARVWYATP